MAERLSPYATPTATREVLERHGLYTKYGLGQNFLVNDDIIRKILNLADVQPTDCILEVGPGIGTLTYPLLAHAARVIAVEKDADLPDVLADTLADMSDRFTLLSMDALDVTAETLTLACAAPASTAPASPAVPAATAPASPAAPAATAPASPAIPAATASASQALPNKLVSNLPYAVAATVVLDYLQHLDFLESATVMVQKEVADRMTAKPGTKAYGAYTVKLSLFAQPADRFPVAPGNFFPPPHVESAVLRLNRTIACGPNGQKLTSEQLAAVCQMTDAGFANRRKTLTNSCKTYFSNDPGMQERLPQIFERAGIDPKRRGESLSQDEFIALGLASLT